MTEKKKELCKECLYEENIDDNTCGACKPNSPQSRFTPKASGGDFRPELAEVEDIGE